jgi:hypothetical protein
MAKVEQIRWERVDWTPQPDITAYELAQAMPVLSVVADSDRASQWIIDAVNRLPANVRRHFAILNLRKLQA